MKTNNKGYSTLLALLLVGFMLVLTTGVLGLVLSEYNDTKGMEKYLKAYASAESGVEMAMLEIKEGKLSNTISEGDPKSKIVDSEGGNKSNFITYDYTGLATDTKDVTLESGEYDFIPLNNGIGGKTKNFLLTVSEGPANIHWNIISSTGGISGKGFPLTMETFGTYKKLNGYDFQYQESYQVRDFIDNNSDMFLRLYNPNSDELKYRFKIQSGVPEDRFIKNEFEIASSGIVKLGSSAFKQNLDVDFENSKYTNLLKYSIYNNQ